MLYVSLQTLQQRESKEQSGKATIKVRPTAGKTLSRMKVEKGSHVQTHAAEESKGKCLTAISVKLTANCYRKRETGLKRQKSRRVKARQPGRI